MCSPELELLHALEGMLYVAHTSPPRCLLPPVPPHVCHHGSCASLHALQSSHRGLVAGCIPSESQAIVAMDDDDAFKVNYDQAGTAQLCLPNISF